MRRGHGALDRGLVGDVAGDHAGRLVGLEVEADDLRAAGAQLAHRRRRRCRRARP